MKKFGFKNLKLPALILGAAALIITLAAAPEPESVTENEFVNVASANQTVYEADNGATGQDYGSFLGKSSKEWYEDIDPNQPIPKKPNYSRYSLRSIVQPGDVIFDPQGFGGLTGHIFMVDSIRHDAEYGDYILASEASGYLDDASGKTKYVGKVFYSIMDDDRVDDQNLQIWRVKNATPAQRQAAVDFEYSQIGKAYSFNFFSYGYNADRKAWYCSELAWAAYKNQGIEIRNQSITQTPLMVTPRDVSIDSQATERIPV
ncbi:MAG: hypothetical protein LBB10_01305 [Bifidobacteriaceae bacterium]|jgi:uncharacterized protein YycO|nr:hypothetical protein [Bifidobacteriaceae bacterium]